MGASEAAEAINSLSGGDPILRYTIIFMALMWTLDKTWFHWKRKKDGTEDSPTISSKEDVKRLVRHTQELKAVTTKLVDGYSSLSAGQGVMMKGQDATLAELRALDDRLDGAMRDLAVNTNMLNQLVQRGHG